MAGFVPTNSTWALWVAAGYPVGNPFNPSVGGGTGQLSANTYTYKGCDGTSLVDVDVTLVLTGVTHTTSIVNGETFDYYEPHLKVVSDTVLSKDLIVYVQFWQRGDPYNTTYDCGYFIGDDDFTAEFDVGFTIPSGTTVAPQPYSFAFPYGWLLVDTNSCYKDLQNTMDVDSNQGTIPSCAAPAPTCTLEITGTTDTNPTLQGGSDGSITVSISGGTAPITYALNGGTPQASGTFTGLAAGTYYVYVEDDTAVTPCYDQTAAIILEDGEFRTGDFIVTEPNDYLAAENPIVTTLGTANNGIPTLAVSTLTFDAGIEDNYSVVFNLTAPQAYSATFIAKDFPNRDNYFTTTILDDSVGNPIGINTLEEVADSFGEAIQKDINLNRWYFVSVTDDTVTLTAKEARNSMTLTSSNVSVLDEAGAVATTGITLINTVAGIDAFQGSLVSDYSIYNDVYVGDGELEYGEDLSGGTYFNYSQLELPFDIRTNQHQFDVSEIMKTFVFTPKIDLTFTGFTQITSMLRPFYVRYGEKYPLVANTNTKKKRSKGDTGYKWVLNSAIQWEDANDMGAYFTGGTFLTNAPNPLDIQRNQTNYLYFILPKDVGTTLTLQGDIDYYDGTSQTGITFINIASGTTNAGGVYALNVSYDSLGLAAFEASGNTKIKRCSFAVYSNAALYSEERTYRFEIDEQPRKFGVSFQNKLGAFDTFDFIGVVEETIDRNKKTYTIPREIRSDGSSPEGFKNTATFDTRVTKKLVVNSGWIDNDHFDWLIELLSSNNVYSYTEPNQNYLNVDGFKYTQSSLDDLYEIEVNFTATIYENNVTV